jgi:hypothetical protein
MMNGTVIENKHAPRTWIWIHMFKKAFKPQDEIIAIVTSNLYVTIDNTIKCESGKN